MKASKSIFLILISILMFAGGAFAAPPDSLYISFIEGDVQIRVDDESGWVPASINTPLVEGQGIWVPKGARTELLLKDGAALRLDADTALEILTLADRDLHFHLTTGRAYINYGQGSGKMFRMDTAHATVYTDQKSTFDVQTSDENVYARISVFSGSVHVESAARQARVDAGQILSLEGDEYAKVAPLEFLDEWERWNVDRDGRYVYRGTSYQYLPDELKLYAGDFDEYGRWVDTSEYGWVWTPRVAVSVGWAPYRIGRWTWIGGDYVWISYEPWGWAPHHYGRWSFIKSFGWCWVPPFRHSVYWSPGYVGWVSTPTYISWVPLAPREIYYGYGNYGPYSVDVRRMKGRNLAGQRIVYRNVRVNNAVTAVNRDTFVSGRHGDVNVREPRERFQRGEISLGRPDIRPEKAARMPVIREIPRREQPPPQVQPRILKEKRPPVQQKRVVPATQRPPEGKRLTPEKPVPPKVNQPSMPRKPQVAPPVREEIRKPREFRPLEKGTQSTRPTKPTTRDLKKPEILRPSGRTQPQSAGGNRPAGGVPVKQRARPPEKAVNQSVPGRSKELRKDARPSMPGKSTNQDRVSPGQTQNLPSQEIRSQPRVTLPGKGRSTESNKEVGPFMQRK